MGCLVPMPLSKLQCDGVFASQSLEHSSGELRAPALKGWCPELAFDWSEEAFIRNDRASGCALARCLRGHQPKEIRYLVAMQIRPGSLRVPVLRQG